MGVLQRSLAVGIVVLCISDSVTRGGDAAATQPATQPVRAIFWEKGKDLMMGNAVGHGDPVGEEYFGFDPKERKSGAASGSMIMTMKEDPIPRVVSLSSGFSGSMWPRYKNAILDFAALKSPPESFYIGSEFSTAGDPCGEVELSLANVKEVFISPDYVIFDGAKRSVDGGGPFATLKIGLLGPKAPGKIPGDATLIVRRNGKELGRTNAAGARPITPYTLKLIGVKPDNDVVEWEVLGAGGEKFDSGSLAFPVSGAAEGRVSYMVLPATWKEKAAPASGAAAGNR